MAETMERINILYLTFYHNCIFNDTKLFIFFFLDYELFLSYNGYINWFNMYIQTLKTLHGTIQASYELLKK